MAAAHRRLMPRRTCIWIAQYIQNIFTYTYNGNPCQIQRSHMQANQWIDWFLNSHKIRKIFNYTHKHYRTIVRTFCNVCISIIVFFFLYNRAKQKMRINKKTRILGLSKIVRLQGAAMGISVFHCENLYYIKHTISQQATNAHKLMNG